MDGSNTSIRVLAQIFSSIRIGLIVSAMPLVYVYIYMCVCVCVYACVRVSSGGSPAIVCQCRSVLRPVNTGIHSP